MEGSIDLIKVIPKQGNTEPKMRRQLRLSPGRDGGRRCRCDDKHRTVIVVTVIAQRGMSLANPFRRNEVMMEYDGVGRQACSGLPANIHEGFPGGVPLRLSPQVI